MKMESSRKHSFDRSRESGPKRPRLAGESSLRSHPFQQRQQRPENSGSAASAVSLRSRSIDRESDESVRGPYQPPPNQLRHQRELVLQYKAALSQLTFNSKPIITNLTIIAGENSHDAKLIAGTVCTNILEVPTEQKLPSLYLLDSIVKNIGRDYIKYFAARLPEVFCNAYRWVDRSVQPGMRHLFGTWKGVFPSQSLQIIERELGFTVGINGSSSGSTTTTAESQSRRQPRSIHVNPKFMEARLQQSSRPKEVASDISGTSLSSTEDMERPSQIVRVGSERPWRDSSIKLHNFQHHQIKESRDSGLDKPIGIESEDYEYDSSVSRHLTSRVGKINDKTRDEAYDKRRFSVGGGCEDSVSSQRDGYVAQQNIQSYTPSRLASVHLPPTKNIANRSTGEMSRSWKNCEEEEYMWDNLNHRVSNYVPADSEQDHWGGDDLDELEFAEVGLENDRNIDSLSSEKVHLGHQRCFSWQLRERLPLHGSDNSLPRTSFKSKVVPAQAAVPSFGLPGSSGSVGKQHLSSGKPLISQQSSLSSSSMRDPRLNLPERVHMHVNPVAQPNRNPPPFSALLDTGLQNSKFQDSLPGLHKDLHLDNNNKSDLQASFQSRQQNPLVQLLPLGHSEVETVCRFQKPVLQQGSPPGTLENAVRESVGQSSTSSLLAAIMKSGILSGSLSAGVKPPLSTKFPQPLLSDPVCGSLSSSSSLNDSSSLLSQGNTEKPSSFPDPKSSSSPSCTITLDATTSGSNSIASLLNTLVEKGLISTSKAESATSYPSLSQNPSNQVPTVATTTSFEVPKVPVSSTIPSSLNDSLTSSESAPFLSDVEPQAQETEIECLLGFEFRPDILRKFHSTVVDCLFDSFLYSCSICGLRLKLKKRLDRHLEWHALKQTKPDNSKMPSRRWFSKSEDWVPGKTELTFGFSQPGSLHGQSKATMDSEPTVPADESSSVCLLCGELFDDVYSQETDQWMFKGAVYMTIPFKGGKDDSTCWSTRPGTIVHAKCMSDKLAHDIGLSCNVKLERNV